MTASKGRLLASLATLSALIVVSGACSSGGLAGAGSSPPVIAGASAVPAQATTDPADCIDITIPAEARPAPTVDQATQSALILVGTFKGYGPEKWNTPDGLRPAKAARAHGIGARRSCGRSS